MKRTGLLLCGLGLVLLPHVLTAQSAAPEQATPGLRAGDVVRITVWRQPELSGEFEVSGEGTIAHPVYRRVTVTGVPLTTAEQRVRALLDRYEKNPEFVMEPLFLVGVGGEVRQPNLYRVRPQTTIAEAVALAGGPTERGRIDAVRVFRGGGQLQADLTQPHVGLAASPVQSGDQISITRRQDVLRDYVAPLSSITAALVGIVALFVSRSGSEPEQP